MRHRVTHMAKWLNRLTNGAIFVIPALAIYAAVSGEIPSLSKAWSDAHFVRFIALAVIAAIGLALLIRMLWILRSILKDCVRGAVLVPETTENVQRLGRAILALAIFQSFDNTLISLAESIGKASGDRSLVVSFGSSDLLMLLCAGLVYLIGWIFAEAVSIDRENREFV